MYFTGGREAVERDLTHDPAAGLALQGMLTRHTNDVWTFMAVSRKFDLSILFNCIVHPI